MCQENDFIITKHAKERAIERFGDSVFPVRGKPLSKKQKRRLKDRFGTTHKKLMNGEFRGFYYIGCFSLNCVYVVYAEQKTAHKVVTVIKWDEQKCA